MREKDARKIRNASFLCDSMILMKLIDDKNQAKEFM